MTGNLTSPYLSRGAWSLHRTLVRDAWFEWRVNASMRGAALDALPIDPPAWFRREELGFAFEHGPSLQWTLTTLAVANARAVKQLGREAPWRLMRPEHKTRDPSPRRSDRLRPAKRRRGGGVAVPI